MPDKENKTLKFNHFQKELPVPFIVYADFETITEKIKTCTPENQSYTGSISETHIVWIWL